MSESVTVLIVGEGPVAEALAAMLSPLGWTCRRATGLDDAEAGMEGTDAVVVTSHHEDLDAPAIRAALAAGVPYVGGMGSRKTQIRRRDWLLANGVPEADLAAVHAPIGLDVGADAPGEIAISILAEIVAVRRGATDSVASISARGGAIHPGQEPGTAYCPTG